MASDNPYQAPASPVGVIDKQEQSVRGITLHYDSGIIVRRWLGCWIDIIGALACLGIPDWILGNALYQKTLAVWLLLALAYFIVPELLWGRTLGKLLTGTVVVNERGGRPGIGQVLIRTVFRLIEVNPIIAGGIPAGIAAAVSKRKQRLGDMAANTYVMYARDLAKIAT